MAPRAPATAISAPPRSAAAALAAAAAMLLASAPAAQAAPFTPGNLLALRVGPEPGCGSTYAQLPAYLVEISTNPA